MRSFLSSPVGPLALPCLALAGATVVSAPCAALEAPKESQHDRRMRVISYNPDQVVDLHAWRLESSVHIHLRLISNRV